MSTDDDSDANGTDRPGANLSRDLDGSMDPDYSASFLLRSSSSAWSWSVGFGDKRVLSRAAPWCALRNQRRSPCCLSRDSLAGFTLHLISPRASLPMTACVCCWPYARLAWHMWSRRGEMASGQRMRGTDTVGRTKRKVR
eukprot:1329119-Rhodomonas_salina.2